jgi:hypothetical protein
MENAKGWNEFAHGKPETRRGNVVAMLRLSQLPNKGNAQS